MAEAAQQGQADAEARAADAEAAGGLEHVAVGKSLLSALPFFDSY